MARVAVVGRKENGEVEDDSVEVHPQLLVHEAKFWPSILPSVVFEEFLGYNSTSDWNVKFIIFQGKFLVWMMVCGLLVDGAVYQMLIFSRDLWQWSKPAFYPTISALNPTMLCLNVESLLTYILEGPNQVNFISVTLLGVIN